LQGRLRHPVPPSPQTAKDRREAYNEYDRELVDARKDYTQEMRERGYLRRGNVEVLD
jgi:hypothetical protein